LFGDFLENCFVPLLQSPRFMRRKSLVVMDPAGKTRQATSETTAYGMVEGLGLDVEVAMTNDIAPRLHVIEQWLTKMVAQQDMSPAMRRSLGNGETAATARSYAALQIDPSCTALIAGLEGSYRYKRKKSGELEVTPEKKHPISDVMDCFGYAGLGMTVPRLRRKLRGREFGRRELQSVPGPRAWA
jgi:hypothetical protein